MSIRIYALEEDGAFKRIARSKFERLLSDANTPDSTEPYHEFFPKYAGKKVRIVIAHLLMEQRKPVYIRRFEYALVAFGPEGQLDRQDYWDRMRLVSEVNAISLPKDNNVINFQKHLAKKRLGSEYRWLPTTKQVNELIDLIFS